MLAIDPRRKEHERRTDLAHLPEPMPPRWRLGGHGVSLIIEMPFLRVKNVTVTSVSKCIYCVFSFTVLVIS